MQAAAPSLQQKATKPVHFVQRFALAKCTELVQIMHTVGGTGVGGAMRIMYSVVTLRAYNVAEKFMPCLWLSKLEGRP